MFKCRQLRPFFHVSQDEMAFTRRSILRILGRLGFLRCAVRYFDFLHPATPPCFLDLVDGLGRSLERIPVLRAASGSMIITAER
jgi:hypothetical protein